MLSENLLAMRRLHHLTQEQLAARLGVSRQAVAKWETGETTPDITNCIELARVYDVSLDDLVHYSAQQTGFPMPPRGKHIFGTVTVGDKGQIVIPKRAREIFAISPGDRLLVLGDEGQGIAILKEKDMLNLLALFRDGGAQ
jgi:AbrB family looped-hinge helix DNA binding protein